MCRKSLLQINTAAPLATRLDALFAKKGAIDLAGVSIALELSVRSLQRRLTAENTSYHMLLDAYRHGKALKFVRAGQLAKIAAHELGFEDEGSFRRSFKRWTGTSPARWRDPDG